MAAPSVGLAFVSELTCIGRQLSWLLAEPGILASRHYDRGRRSLHRFLLRKISAAANSCRAVRQQSRIHTRLGKSRFHFRRAPQEQRDEGWTSSRFIALRQDQVAPFKRTTCVSVDHG